MSKKIIDVEAAEDTGRHSNGVSIYNRGSLTAAEAPCLAALLGRGNAEYIFDVQSDLCSLCAARPPRSDQHLGEFNNGSGNLQPALICKPKDGIRACL
jgi:hypothetical protein